MEYDEWIKLVPNEITRDSLWKMKAYRLSLFAADLSWLDVTKLMNDKRTQNLSGQLYKSIGSVSANIAEGYSRGTGKDRARFYEYTLGSARESRDWYFKGRHILGQEVMKHRIGILTQVIRLLLTMVPEQRTYNVNEPDHRYGSDIEDLLRNVPRS